jgi:hypothetical protein
VIFDLLLHLNGHFKIMQKKLNIFQFNVKLFNVSGVIPSENINSSSWKSALFRIFQSLSLLLYIPKITLHFISIYRYCGNIILMANIIGTLVASVFLCIIIFCTASSGKRLWRNRHFWKEFYFLQRIGQIKPKTYENLERDLESGTNL